jgi:hypothetical protein
MSEIEPGDVVMARGSSGSFYAVVRGLRLNRVVVERCDGRPSGPLSVRDIVEIFKATGEPDVTMTGPLRKRPSSQLRLDLE